MISSRPPGSWIEGDPDPETREALQAIVDAGDRAAMADAMGEPLTFGTAGIRGEVGPGSGRMNRATVIRTTRGLADYLITKHNGPPERPVALGFDARPDSRNVCGGHRRCVGSGRDRRQVLPGGHADATGGVRSQAPRCAGGGRDHRQPQPSRRQRLQGLRPQRRPDHSPDGRRDRGGDRCGSAPLPRCHESKVCSQAVPISSRRCPTTC